MGNPIEISHPEDHNAYAHGLEAGRCGKPPDPPKSLESGSRAYQKWIEGHRRGMHLRTQGLPEELKSKRKGKDERTKKRFEEPLRVELTDGDAVTDSWSVTMMGEMQSILTELLFSGALDDGKQITIRRD